MADPERISRIMLQTIQEILNNYMQYGYDSQPTKDQVARLVYEEAETWSQEGAQQI